MRTGRRRAKVLVRWALGLVGFGPRYTSSLIVMIQAYLHLYNGRTAFSLVKGHLVGLGGLEPPPSSLSEIDGRAPCYPAFPLVMLLRKSHRDGVNRGAAAERYCGRH
jgi:hypothetical protein